MAFSTVPGIGAARLKLLIEFFGSAELAWKSSERQIRETGLPKNVVAEFLQTRNKLGVDQYMQNLNKRGIKYVTIESSDYPQRLKNIPDAPNVLFLKSNFSIEQFNILTMQKIIGVVGTRKMTSYGKEVTEQLVTGLVSNGFTIVSGMALGVDGVAHGTTINLGGKTVAVLGAGVDIIYPLEHRALYNSILEHGGSIVSEVAPEKTVIRGIFPARNRIISGLCEAVLVTEGALDSGSLITAKAALDQGREVFAIPGPINSAMAEGTNYLIKQGAKMVTSVDDILEGLGYETKVVNSGTMDRKKVTGDTPEEQKIIDLLMLEPLDFDELIRKSGYKNSSLGAILSLLEIKGKLKFDNRFYRLI